MSFGGNSQEIGEIGTEGVTVLQVGSEKKTELSLCPEVLVIISSHCVGDASWGVFPGQLRRVGRSQEAFSCQGKASI